MITLTTRQLHALLKPVLPLTGTDYDLPILASVHLTVRNGYVFAAATDRFRAGVKRVELDTNYPQADTFHALVGTYDAARILTLFKPGRASVIKQPRLRLSVEDGLLVAEAIQSKVYEERHDFEALRLAVPALNGAYPDVFSLILKAATDETDRVTSMSFNAEFMAAFREATRWVENTSSSVVPMHVRFGVGSTKPAAVRIGDDFIGVLMPRRDYAVDQPWALNGWADDLQALTDRVESERKAIGR